MSCLLARIASFLALFCALSTTAIAHPTDGEPGLANAWSLSPWFLVPALAALALYLLGLAILWRRAGTGHGVSIAETAAFGTGVVTVFLATVWPLDAYGEWSLAAHMAQHMLLLAVAPPLLLAGRPVAVSAHALRQGWAGPLNRACGRMNRSLVGSLGLAAGAQVAVMAVWHLPAATTAALAHDGVHGLMHASFLLAGFWFWAALWHRVREPSIGAGPALVCIVVVMMSMGFIGALLTFSRRALYPVYAHRAPALGLDVLVDQQLAGLIMWVPSSLPYLIGGLWLMRQGLRRAERRQRENPTRPGPPRDRR